jgi:UV DNA damage endonuclease
MAKENRSGRSSGGAGRREGIRWGLCCLFVNEPIRFGVRTAAYLKKFDRDRQLALLAESVLVNGRALVRAIEYCHGAGIGAFRVNSRIFPLKTHPEVGYRIADLPGHAEIEAVYRLAGETAARLDIRLSLHPDQFTLLSSPDEGVTGRSIAELVYQAGVAERIGADVITLHGGGAYGDRAAALARLEANLERLPETVRSRLVLENDDRIYTPADLLPLCARTGLPFHLSSPRDGWQGGNPRPHHDFIDPGDLPACWVGRQLTVEVEAKAKELALQRLIAAQAPRAATP